MPRGSVEVYAKKKKKLTTKIKDLKKKILKNVGFKLLFTSRCFLLFIRIGKQNGSWFEPESLRTHTVVDAGGDTGKRRHRGAQEKDHQHKRGARHVTCRQSNEKHTQTSGQEKTKLCQVRWTRVFNGYLKELDVGPAKAYRT